MDKKLETKYRAITRMKAGRPILSIARTGTVVALLTILGVPTTFAQEADIDVFKTANCSCCVKWIAHLRDSGLEVSVVNVPSTQTVRSRLGIPLDMGSCHTAVTGDYWVEGHVPVDLVQRLLAENPEDIKGIAVPGMAAGSPGMESPNAVRYDVLALDANGNTTVYATRQGSSD